MKLFTLFLLTLLFCNTTYGQDYYFVSAESGLNVRSENNLSSKKVAKIPFGVMVEKISDTNNKITINDNRKEITGKWVKIKYNNYLYLVSEETEQFEKEGYVFDGYLKRLKNDSVVSKTKIGQNKYYELRRKASKQIFEPKKIENLDSIKVILKNRVEWVTEFENEDYKRDDQIKSIKIKNGQKLMLNQIGNDYGFSKGWSGYYPKYDILVLEGGHSSDMTFSIKTGETDLTIGNPEYIIPSPKNTYRLNGYFGGQECISYFFQKNINGKFIYLTEFNWDFDICTFKEFLWINETTFIYKTMNYNTDSVNETEEYYKGEIKTTHN